MRIDRRIIHELPLPLARVYERAVNAEDGKDLHDRALLVFEVFVHWLAISALGSARAVAGAASPQDPPALELRATLGRFAGAKLERPSRGTWLELLRSLAGKKGKLLESLGRYLGEPLADPAVETLLETISKALGGDPSGRRKITAAQLMDRLVHYRNRTVGHGASLEPEAYAALAVPLFEGISALVAAASFLVEFPVCVFREAIHRSDGTLAASLSRLMGIAPLRDPAARAPDGIAPGTIFVDAGADGFLITPWAVYRDKALFLYNGIGQDGAARYLCFDDNRQIAEGSREQLFAGLAGEPSAEAPRSGPAIGLRLSLHPERARAGEPFHLQVEMQSAARGGPVTLEATVSPPDALVPIGPAPLLTGPFGETSTLSFHHLALRQGQVSFDVEARTGGERILESLTASILPPLSPSFVGRDEIRQRIGRWLEAPGAGLFCLRGEHGVGKSRLAQEVALTAGAGGALVVFGKGRRSIRFPMQPFREMMLELLHQSDSGTGPARLEESIQSLLRHRLREEGYIVEFVKAFLARESIAPEQKAMAPVFWLSLFQKLGNGGTCVLVIDDIQWTEAETVQLIAGVLGLAHQRGAPLKVIATVQPFGLRPEEDATLAQLQSKIGDLKADRVSVETLDLRPLGGGELDLLLDESFPGRSFRRDLPWLYKRLQEKTGGSPLFAEWVIKQLKAELEPKPRAAEEPGGSRSPVPTLTREWFDAFVPEEIGSVLDQRLGSLPAEAREALEVAAAVGDPFDLRLLEILLGGVAALDAALPRMEEEELVVPHENANCYRFAHALIPQKVYRDFTQKSRWKATRLHARIAEAMSSTYSEEELTQNALAYAHHLILGNRREEGLRFLVRGASRLVELQLYASAAPHLEEASQLATSGVALSDADRATLFFRLGETYRILGRIDAAVEALEAAKKGPGSDSSLEASIDLALASIHVQRGEIDRAEGIYRAVLSMPLAESQLKVAAAVSGIAAIQRIRGRLDEALSEHLRALELRKGAGAETEVAISWVNAGNTYFDLGSYREAEAAYRKSLPIFEARGLKSFQIHALSGLGNVFFKSDHAQAIRFYEDAMRLCQETGNRTQLGVLCHNLGEIALAGHRYSEALRELDRALEIMVAVGRRAGESEGRCRKAEIHRMMGQLDAAACELERARDVARTTGNVKALAAAQLEAAWLSHARGEASESRRHLDDALRSLDGAQEGPLRLACAQLLADLGEAARARELIACAEATPGLDSDPGTACLLEHLKGLASGSANAALPHLERALLLASENYAELPRLLDGVASAVEPDRARGLLERAVRTLEARASSIEDGARRRSYLLENVLHREILGRARDRGVAVGTIPDAT